MPLQPTRLGELVHQHSNNGLKVAGNVGRGHTVATTQLREDRKIAQSVSLLETVARFEDLVHWRGFFHLVLKEMQEKVKAEHNTKKRL